MENLQQKTATNLIEFTQLLKDNGFSVIAPAKYDEWIYFFKDGNFGTVSKDRIHGFDFSTVHKPCRECGTGYRVTDNFAELTIENANKSLCHHPNWAKPSGVKAIRKYSTIDEFINHPNNKWANYSVI